MNHKSYFKIWEIKDLGKTAEVRMSTSRKVGEAPGDAERIKYGVAKKGYVNTNWQYVKFVGKAYNQLKKYFDGEPGATITNLDMSLEKEPYWDDNEKKIAYPKNFKFTVFGFDVANEERGKNIDKAPKVANDEDYAEEEKELDRKFSNQNEGSFDEDDEEDDEDVPF